MAAGIPVYQSDPANPGRVIQIKVSNSGNPLFLLEAIDAEIKLHNLRIFYGDCDSICGD